jgi:hypothetical protein
MSEPSEIDLAAEATTMRLTVAESPETELLQCEGCGSRVDLDQRYCLHCGAHRQSVDDPAARYLSEAGAARARVAAATARAAAAPKRRRGAPGLVLALLVALIPAGVAVGVSVGRSSNSQDAQLIQALAKERARVVTTSGGASAVGSRSTGNSSKGNKSGRSHNHKGSNSSAASNKAPTVSSIQKQEQSNVAHSEQAAQQAQNAKGASNVTNQESKNTGLVGIP